VTQEEVAADTAAAAIVYTRQSFKYKMSFE
jgi:hypothetical protein